MLARDSVSVSIEVSVEDLAIPNRANLALAAAFILFAALFPLPPGALTAHLLFGAGMLVFGVVAFKMGSMGGGFAKFNAVVALWFGPAETYAFFVILTCFGGLAVWRVAAWLGRPDRGVPVGMVGIPAAWLLFLTTPMWAGIKAGFGYFA